MSRILVAYFSAGGVTEKAAKESAADIGADVYAIRPAEPYTAEDLNYMNAKSRSSVEMGDPSSRPALADKDAKIEDYDVIYVGYPIWWGAAPHVVNSFLEAYDFTGKTIIPFATSGGSPIGDAKAYLGVSAPGAVFKEGKRIGGIKELDALKIWMEGMV